MALVGIKTIRWDSGGGEGASTAGASSRRAYPRTPRRLPLLPPARGRLAPLASPRTPLTTSPRRRPQTTENWPDVAARSPTGTRAAAVIDRSTKRAKVGGAGLPDKAGSAPATTAARTKRPWRGTPPWLEKSRAASTVGRALAAPLILAALAAVACADTGPLLDAMTLVESGGRLNPPDGDNGRSIGPLQIQRAYWQDANMPAGWYEDCRDATYARCVVEAYWRRYEPAALARLDYQTLARVHNGGPRGASKRATLGYWHKVRAALAAQGG